EVEERAGLAPGAEERGEGEQVDRGGRGRPPGSEVPLRGGDQDDRARRQGIGAQQRTLAQKLPRLAQGEREERRRHGQHPAQGGGGQPGHGDSGRRRRQAQRQGSSGRSRRGRGGEPLAGGRDRVRPAADDDYAGQ